MTKSQKPKEYEQWEKDLIKNHSLELLYYASDNDNEVENLLKAIRQLLKAERERTIEMADAAEMLWVVLANVSGGDWTKQNDEWQEAAAKWRDNYFRVLSTLKK